MSTNRPTAMPAGNHAAWSALNPEWPWPKILILGALFLLCCFARLWDLGSKAIMHDEALFVYYAYEQMYNDLTYRYLPILHGPLHLMTQAVIWHIAGVTDYTMRLGVALAGIGGFVWIWTLRRYLGAVGTWFALLFYALSPGVTNFARFYREDGWFVFITLWIVASGAHWWHTRNPRWLASFIFAVVLLFCNKESSLFVYFSVVTFFVLLILADLVKWFFEGKDEALPASDAFTPAPSFPSPFLAAGLFGLFVTLCLTRIFEGISYDADVVEALKHDFVLKDVYSIPLALGWVADRPELGEVGLASYWRKFYLAVFGGFFAAFLVMKFAVDRRIGHREFLTRFWRQVVDARWHVAGALAGGVAIYLAIFTTLFKNPLGPFEIYRMTWAYWGGQHEWGRIGGPFHMHSVNLLVYELPAVLIIAFAWLRSLFVVQWTRTTGFAVLLTTIAAAAFHGYLFMGFQVLDGSATPAALHVSYLKTYIGWALLAGIAIMVLPGIGRGWFAAAMVAFTAYSIWYFSGSQWNQFMTSAAYKDGKAIEMLGRHVTGADYMEIQLNMDGGWNLYYVMVLVVFATVLTWHAIERREYFHGFLIWWTVTALGAASYAREAVPQVGIHAALPAVLLAGSYFEKLWNHRSLGASKGLLLTVLGVMALWNAKANFNLNFRNADDIREKMVYGHTPQELRRHARLVEEYYYLSSLRTNQIDPPGEAKPRSEWIANYNEPGKQKQVRILVKGSTIWPLRWYFRELDWTEFKDTREAVNERWEFLFLDVGEAESIPEIAANYHMYRGRALVFWTPNPVNMSNLLDAWKLLIPGHRLDGSPQAGQAWNAKQEWKLIRNYLLFRHTFDGEGRDYASVSGTEYVFCVRKDLY